MASAYDHNYPKEEKNEVEIAQMDDKAGVYRMTEAEVPLEQRKEEARVM
jgi:hypothetical protein